LAVMPSNSPISDQRSCYVAISRATDSAHIYTDSRSGLIAGLQERTGEKSAALDNSMIKELSSVELRMSDMSGSDPVARELSHELPHDEPSIDQELSNAWEAGKEAETEQERESVDKIEIDNLELDNFDEQGHEELKLEDLIADVRVVNVDSETDSSGSQSKEAEAEAEAE